MSASENWLAFPLVYDDVRKSTREVHTGMNLRQYAAIRLRVPESGDAWLDDMIRKSVRDELAGKAMPELFRSVFEAGVKQGKDAIQIARTIAGSSYDLADAMLKARRQ